MRMIQTTVEAAQIDLPQLLEKIRAGEEIVIAENGKALARIVAVEDDDEASGYNPKSFGMDEGKIWIAPDFNETSEEIIKMFYGEEE